jgi:hypothetical protein
MPYNKCGGRKGMDASRYGALRIEGDFYDTEEEIKTGIFNKDLHRIFYHVI